MFRTSSLLPARENDDACLFFFYVLHRRCMAVVSPWCQAVQLAGHGHLPFLAYPLSEASFFLDHTKSARRLSVLNAWIKGSKDHVKSSWPIWGGLHVCDKDRFNAFSRHRAKEKTVNVPMVACNSAT